jgi:hypothetical protein
LKIQYGIVWNGGGILKKLLKKVFVVLVFGLTVWFGIHIYMNSYIPYEPIMFLPGDGEGGQETLKLNTQEIQKKIKLLLNGQQYVKWKIQDGKLMIQRKMMFGDFNLNYLRNLTKKADDPNYILETYESISKVIIIKEIMMDFLKRTIEKLKSFIK